MAWELDSSHFPTTCCVCAAIQVPHEEGRRVSKAFEFTALRQKLDEISQVLSRDNWQCDFGCQRFQWSNQSVKLTIVARPYLPCPRAIRGWKQGLARQTKLLHNLNIIQMPCMTLYVNAISVGIWLYRIDIRIGFIPSKCYICACAREFNAYFPCSKCMH